MAMMEITTSNSISVKPLLPCGTGFQPVRTGWKPVPQGRSGFTLIELLVVISIIAILATITPTYFPSFDGTRRVVSGTDSTTGWLLIAKQRAKRDGLPTGIRFAVNKT